LAFATEKSEHELLLRVSVDKVIYNMVKLSLKVKTAYY